MTRVHPAGRPLPPRPEPLAQQGLGVGNAGRPPQLRGLGRFLVSGPCSMVQSHPCPKLLPAACEEGLLSVGQRRGGGCPGEPTSRSAAHLPSQAAVAVVSAGAAAEARGGEPAGPAPAEGGGPEEGPGGEGAPGPTSSHSGFGAAEPHRGPVLRQNPCFLEHDCVPGGPCPLPSPVPGHWPRAAWLGRVRGQAAYG